jgi:hypothetical protein
MEAYESDLYYDCRGVGDLQPGESVYWFVSGLHTYLYSAKGINDANLSVKILNGNRFNYRIDCVKGKFGDLEYSMTQVGEMEIQMDVNKYQKTLIES